MNPIQGTPYQMSAQESAQLYNALTRPSDLFLIKENIRARGQITWGDIKTLLEIYDTLTRPEIYEVNGLFYNHVVDLSNYDGDEETLSIAVEYFFSHVNTLEFSSCTNVGVRELCIFEKSVPNLQYLSFSACPNIKDDIFEIVRRFPSLLSISMNNQPFLVEYGNQSFADVLSADMDYENLGRGRGLARPFSLASSNPFGHIARAQLFEDDTSERML